MTPQETFDEVVSRVRPQEFAIVPAGGTGWDTTIAVIPRCSKCGEVIKDFKMAIWASLEAYDKDFKTVAWTIRCFHRETCDVFASASHEYEGLITGWWEFSQLWQLDQRHEFEKPRRVRLKK